MKNSQKVTGGLATVGVAIGLAVSNYAAYLFGVKKVEALEGHSIVFSEPEESEPAPVPVDPENLEDFDILPVYPMIDMGDPVDEISFPESEPTVIQSPKSCPPTTYRSRGIIRRLLGR